MVLNAKKKLEKSYHISGSALRWFSSYLGGRVQRVVVNGKASDWAPVRSGTPEGGLLSPLLFAMYINDLPNHITNSCCLMFADDVKIFRKVTCRADADILQEDLNRLCKWSRTWKLNLNPLKCKSFRMTLKRFPIYNTYCVENTALEHVGNHSGPGCDFGSKVNFFHTNWYLCQKS